MHTKPMDDTEGDFSDLKASEYPCRYCKVVGQNFYREWDSSDGGYTDYKHECHACGKMWWIEGDDG